MMVYLERPESSHCNVPYAMKNLYCCSRSRRLMTLSDTNTCEL